MAQDVLILGPVAFTDFSTPSHMPFGGEQAMVVHKLPGGSRVIDTLGPDDMDISWHGRFWANDAYQTALLLDAMRRAGQVLPLSFAGQAYLCVIREFEAQIERLPQDILYRICVVTVTNATGAVSGAIGGAALAAADLAAAMAIAAG